jgi:hypothetical protein
MPDAAATAMLWEVDLKRAAAEAAAAEASHPGKKSKGAPLNACTA